MIVVVVSLASLGRTQNKECINRVITTARWIYVVSDEGDEFSGRVSLEDRQAITNLAGAIEKWGYYKLRVEDRARNSCSWFTAKAEVGYLAESTGR
jgi:hypothetical protein